VNRRRIRKKEADTAGTQTYQNACRAVTHFETIRFSETSVMTHLSTYRNNQENFKVKIFMLNSYPANVENMVSP